MQQFEVDDGGVQKKNPPETPIERVYSRMFRWGWVRWIVTTCLLGLAIAQISNSIKKQGAIFSIYNIILAGLHLPLFGPRLSCRDEFDSRVGRPYITFLGFSSVAWLVSAILMFYQFGAGDNTTDESTLATDKYNPFGQGDYTRHTHIGHDTYLARLVMASGFLALVTVALNGLILYYTRLAAITKFDRQDIYKYYHVGPTKNRDHRVV